MSARYRAWVSAAAGQGLRRPSHQGRPDRSFARHRRGVAQKVCGGGPGDQSQSEPHFFHVRDYSAVLSITDRDAILVRKHLSKSARVVTFNCPARSDNGCNYETAPPTFTPP